MKEANEKDYLEDSYTSLNKRIGKAHFESESRFSGEMTKYNVVTHRYEKGRCAKFVKQVGGIPLGGNKELGIAYIDSSDSHTLVFGATGSKKSRLVAMPAVYTHAYAKESMIISDPKAEIYNRCSGILKKLNYRIQVINLRNPSISNSWNPLSIPFSFYRAGKMDKASEFINDISMNLMLSEIAERDPFWDYSASDLFFGLTLLLFRFSVLYNLEVDQVNIGNVIRLRQYLFKSNERRSINAELLNLIDSDTMISSSLMGTLYAADGTQRSILSVFDEKMRSFIIQHSLLDMLSNNTIDLYKASREPSAVFLIIPDEKTTYHRLVTLFIKQSYEYLIYKAQLNHEGKVRLRINYILDEFSALPAMKDFPTMITAARSRNIRFYLIVQSKHQLRQKYKSEAETIQSNCSNLVFFTSREIELLQEISMLCGKQRDGVKPLYPADALQHLNKTKGEALVISGRMYPFITEFIDINDYEQEKLNPVEYIIENRHEFTPIDFSREIENRKQSMLENRGLDYEASSKMNSSWLDELFSDSED